MTTIDPQNYQSSTELTRHFNSASTKGATRKKHIIPIIVYVLSIVK